MDATIKAKWIAALRGGEYIQGKGYLVVPEGVGANTRAVDSAVGSRCCLGVLAAVIGLNSPRTAGYLPSSEGDRIGVSWPVQDKLATMNDSDNASFLEIADWIEANL